MSLSSPLAYSTSPIRGKKLKNSLQNPGDLKNDLFFPISWSWYLPGNFIVVATSPKNLDVCVAGKLQVQIRPGQARGL